MPRHGLPTPGEPHEQVIGPVHGHYLACYTVRDRDGYHGYARLYAERPRDVWDAPHAMAKMACGPFPHPARALVGVVTRVRRQLENRYADTLWWG